MTPEDPIALGLPHREPFIFIDAVVAHEAGISATCTKRFPKDASFFEGHFPANPIVPGVLITEALAQTAGIAGGGRDRTFRLTAIRAMKFFGAVRPEEVITLEARKIGAAGGLWQFETKASVESNVVAEGTIVLSEVSGAVS